MRFILLGILFSYANIFGVDKNDTFRTDLNDDKTLDWYLPKKGVFPPKGSSHYIAGELIWIDHLEREFHIRPDRTDKQAKAVMDLPLRLTLLPYGSIEFNGNPAALQDIPIGTHLHTWVYLKDPKDESPPLIRWHNRIATDSEFRQCLRIEDDFSYHQNRNEIWKIQKVDLDRMEIHAFLKSNGQVFGKTKIFNLLSSTTVYRENEFSTLEKIISGQEVLFNLTWATLYGPGRILEIWLDEKSRKNASARQLARHHDHIRQRGVPGWIKKVDDQKQIVTVTLFDGIDTELFKEFSVIVPEPLGWPTSGGAKDDMKPKGTLAVARSSLMTYDPLNDRKGGNILETKKVAVVPGCSGVEITVECGILLEGFRPGEIVRFFPASWGFTALPKEEQFFGRE